MVGTHESESLVHSLESLSISSAPQTLQVSDSEQPPSPSQLSSLQSSSSDSDDDNTSVHRRPFHVYCMKDHAWQGCKAPLPELADANFGEGPSNSVDFSLHPPSTAFLHSKQDVRRTKREILLSEAWERKRQVMLQDELSKLTERAKPELLGRSASDCGKPIKDACDHFKLGLLERSASCMDCSKPKGRVWGPRTRSLSDHDFEELKGCIDLGFHFDQNSSWELWDTLPALEVCCAVAQNFQDSPCCMSPDSSTVESPAQSFTALPTASWRIAGPGDDDEEVKVRLRHWAQAVACNARLCY